MPERMYGPTPQGVIRRHVEGADDWEWQEIISQLYVWTERINDRFFEREMPDAVPSFERVEHRILAACTLRRNAQGAPLRDHLQRQASGLPAVADAGDLDTRVHALWQQNLARARCRATITIRSSSPPARPSGWTRPSVLGCT
jgi:hypothetical protein